MASRTLAGDRLGTPAVVFFVLSAAAPLTVVAGVVTTGYTVTGITGLPIAFLAIGALLALFAVGYVAMARHVTNAGAFYGYISRGLGRPLGVSGAWIALIAYNIYVPGPDHWLVPLRRSEQPDRWRQLVSAADQPVVTQVGRDPTVPVELCDRATGRGMVATSSSSSPEIMAYMASALELEPSMRVLEIGSGTGYNATVLAYMLGGENVTSIEIDPEIAERARSALDAAGYPVEVIIGDGEDGYPPNAPYHRIIVTAAAHTIPYSWVEQTRTGGLILVPWAPTVHPDSPLARLVVAEDGTAEGRFIGTAGFMPLRGHHLLPRVNHETEQRWIRAGKPDCTRYGITVTPQGQTIWLDTPDNPIDPTSLK